MRLLAPFLAWAFAGAHAADTVYFNGKFVTMAESRPVAGAVAIRGNRFLAVGTDEEARRAAAPGSTFVDLKGRTVLPGLIDSHTHPISSALSEQEGPVPVMRTIPEIQAYIRKLALSTPAGRPIFVPKVYSTRLPERRYPTRRELDEAAPGRIVIADNGYASVLSTAALAKLGITRSTPAPSNGKLMRDKDGEPTGLILGAPQLLAPLRNVRNPTREDLEWALKSMHKRYNEAGITSTIDRGEHPREFRLYQDLRRRGELTVRSYVTYLIGAKGTPDQTREEIESIPFVTGMGDEWFRVGSLKVVADGGILIGTAYLREPYGPNTAIYGYSDADYRGVLAVPKENIFEMARVANRLGWQMTAHTAGGGATDVLLDAYEAAERGRAPGEPSVRDRRFTITHVNFPNASAIARAKMLGVSFDCQPAWHHLDGDAIKDVFGPSRMAHFLPFRDLFDAGIVVAGGSDHMIRFDSRDAINPYNPFFGMWMAITRKTSGGGVLHGEQAATRTEALRMWTLNGAYLSFEETLKGSIEPGKLADMVVIDQDFLDGPVDRIRDANALLTMVDGKVVYRATAMVN
jgi:predicted amidohydrolase YtcJ